MPRTYATEGSVKAKSGIGAGASMRELFLWTRSIERKLAQVGHERSSSLRVASLLTDQAHRSVIFLELMRMIADAIEARDRALLVFNISMLRQSIWDFTQYVGEYRPTDVLASELGLLPASMSHVESAPADEGHSTADWLKDLSTGSMFEAGDLQDMVDSSSGGVATCTDLLMGLRSSCLSLLHGLEIAASEPVAEQMDIVGVLQIVAALAFRPRLDGQSAQSYDDRNLLACLGSTLLASER